MDTHKEQRLLAHYVEFLLDHDSIKSYATAHGLTDKQATEQLNAGMLIYHQRQQQAHNDTLGASGLATFD
jgi:hypothetical protein